MTKTKYCLWLILCVLTLTESALFGGNSAKYTALTDPRGLDNPVYRWNARVVSVKGKPAEKDMIDNDYATAKYGSAWDFENNDFEGIKYFSPGIADPRVANGKLLFATKDNAFFYWGNFKKDDSFPEEDIGFNRMVKYSRRPFLKYNVKIRIKQSLEKSEIQTVLKGYNGWTTTGQTTLKGTEWQTVNILTKCKPGRITAMGIMFDTPGNRMEIDSIKIVNETCNLYLRHTLKLGKNVEKAKICFVTAGNTQYDLYINGQKASSGKQWEPTRFVINEVDCGKYFHKGENLIAYRMNEACYKSYANKMAIEGIIFFKDGTFRRFYTNESWKGTYAFHKDWYKPSYNDKSWPNVVAQANVAMSLMSCHNENKKGEGYFAHPPYMGPVDLTSLSTCKDRHLFEMSKGAEFLIKLKTPAKISYEVKNAMTRKNEQQGVLNNEKPGKIFNLKIKGLTPGVYNLKIYAKKEEKIFDTRFYEFVIIGRIQQKEVLLKDMEKSLKMEMVDEIFCGNASDPHEFLDGAFVANNKFISSSVAKTSIISAINGKNYRSAGPTWADWFSYRFKVNQKYIPHIIEIEYLDNRAGVLVARTTEKARSDGFRHVGETITPRSSASIATGGPYKPLSNKLQKMKMYYLPCQYNATIDILNGNHLGKAGVPIYRIRVYQVNQMPGLKVPNQSNRLFGVMQEGNIIQMRAFNGTPEHEIFSATDGMWRHKHFGFYKNHYNIIANHIKWMRFCGENLWCPGLWMYSPQYKTSVIPPGARTPTDDAVGLCLAMFGANDLYMMPCFEFLEINPYVEDKPASNSEIAAGAKTHHLIGKDGKLQTFEGKGNSFYNPMDPYVIDLFRNIIRDFMDRYGDYSALKGINVLSGKFWQPVVAYVDYNSEDIEDVFNGSYDDITMEKFEKYLGRKIPTDPKDPKRFEQRYEWIQKNAKDKFIKFRAQGLADFHKALRDATIENHPDKIYCALFSSRYPVLLEQGRKMGLSTRKLFCHLGVDPDLYKAQNNLFLGSQRKTPTHQFYDMGAKYSETKSNAWHTSDDFNNAWDNGDASVFFLRNGFVEMFSCVPTGRKWYWGTPWRSTKANRCVNEAHKYYARYMTDCLLKTTPGVIISGGFQDVVRANLGHFEYQWSFAAAFRSIPGGIYKTIKGNGFNRNMLTRTQKASNGKVFYVANPCWWDVKVKIKFPRKTKVKDLVNNEISSTEELEFNQKGYAVNVFISDLAPLRAEGIVSDEGISYMKQQMDILSDAAKLTNGDINILFPGKKRSHIDGLIAEIRKNADSGDWAEASKILDLPELVDLRQFLLARQTRKRTPPRDNYRVICGSNSGYVDSTGKQWLPDQNSEGVLNYGYLEPAGNQVDRSKRGIKYDFPDARLYLTERSRLGGYLFETPPGTYTVKLHYIEGSKARPGMKESSVNINGKLVVKPFDLVTEAGGFGKPLIKTVKGVQAKDGLIIIKWNTNRGRINGIEVIKE